MAKIEDVLKKPVVKKEEKHPKANVQWIHYSKLTRSAFQFYSEESKEVEEIADLLEVDGRVLQNVLCRKIDADQYEIIAGHKRVLACRFNVENRALKQFEFIPCIVIEVNDVRARWQVMSSNWHHDKTQYEIMKEIEDMKYLLETYPEEFPEFSGKGRMVDHLASKLCMSRSVVSDYQNISHNLTEEGKEMFKNQEIDKSAAVALASLSPSEQKALISTGNVSHTSIKTYKNERKAVNELDSPNEEPKVEVKEEAMLPGQMGIKNVEMEMQVEVKPEKKDCKCIICKNSFPVEDTFSCMEDHYCKNDCGELLIRLNSIGCLNIDFNHMEERGMEITNEKR